jgi:hypothetical protein
MIIGIQRILNNCLLAAIAHKQAYNPRYAGPLQPVDRIKYRYWWFRLDQSISNLPHWLRVVW